jgi:hypothetical protein
MWEWEGGWGEQVLADGGVVCVAIGACMARCARCARRCRCEVTGRAV